MPTTRSLLLPLLWLLFILQKPAANEARIFQRCELARELLRRKFQRRHIATWCCIAEHESGFNTAAIGHSNPDGSGDHGLFQINDGNWCSPPGSGKGCRIACDKLRTDDIGAQLQCVRTIFAATNRRVHNGFEAWSTYAKCKRPASVEVCFKRKK